MRTKYNLNGHNKMHYVSKSYIKRYLKEEIDFLLASSVNQLNKVNFDDIYINNTEAEEFLSEALKVSTVDKILYFTGLTGSGKTMILRKVFRINGMSPVFLNDTVIIPFTFDNFKSNESTDKSVRSIFSNMLSCVCEKIVLKFNSIKSAIDNEQIFYDFISQSRGDFTQFKNRWNDISIEERLNNFMKENQIAFYTALLKFYLNQAECPINNVVIVVDDIEGVGENLESLPIKIAYELITCLENQVRSKDWSAQLIISCRHYVYRLIDNAFSQERQRLETYADSDMYHLTKSPAISDIIYKRYEAISKKDKNDKWEVAMNVVIYLLTKIDDKVGEFLLNLNIRNIRKTLSSIKKLIYNKHWIQRDYVESIAGAFSIDSVKNYDVTSATLIRAIGMGESVVYRSNDSLIVNLLYNTEDNMDLFVLLTLQYFLKSFEPEYSDWENSVDIPDFYDKINDIYNNDTYLRTFKHSVDYLLIKRMLLRSIDQLQEDTSPVNTTNVESINKVYVSNAAVDLWNLMGSNSVLFEMYVDDIWLDNTHRTKAKKQFRGFDIDNFNIALEYMDVIIDSEAKFRNKASNLGTLDKYYNTFGKKCISSHLLNGLEISLSQYYRESQYYKESSSIQDWGTKINYLKKRIKNEL